MWPWTHAAVGYLLCSLSLRPRSISLADRPAVLLGVGTQFPDLVDKPLAYTFAVLPAGRALAHSLLVFVPLAVGLWVVWGRYRHLTGSFLFGYATHPVPWQFDQKMRSKGRARHRCTSTSSPR